MRKIRNLIGMPVICNRQKIGRLMQAALSKDLRRMEGIWVDSGLKGTRYIPSEQLSMIGEMAVMADSMGKRRKCVSEPILRRAVSTSGRRMGAIVGAEVDEISFLVQALELTEGIWEDLIDGRLRIEHYSTGLNGEVIVLDSTQETEREVSEYEARHD